MDPKTKQLFSEVLILLMELADLRDSRITSAQFREHLDIFKTSIDKA
jgi:hypothetical protein